MEFNSDYFLISEENEDNNYTNFDISKIKKLLTLKNDKLIFNKIYVLKDGRIIAHNNEHKDKNIFLCFIFDLKNDKCFNININKIYEILQMADGIILIATESELVLFCLFSCLIMIINNIFFLKNYFYFFRLEY